MSCFIELDIFHQNYSWVSFLYFSGLFGRHYSIEPGKLLYLTFNYDFTIDIILLVRY